MISCKKEALKSEAALEKGASKPHVQPEGYTKRKNKICQNKERRFLSFIVLDCLERK